MKNLKLIINEVDCYIGNAANIKEYRTDKATQHQIILVENDVEFTIGRKNAAADENRISRIVHEFKITKLMANKWKEIINQKNKLVSEHCNSIEEYNEAAKKNKPIKTKIEMIFNSIYNDGLIEQQGINLKQFIYLSNY